MIALLMHYQHYASNIKVKGKPVTTLINLVPYLPKAVVFNPFASCTPFTICRNVIPPLPHLLLSKTDCFKIYTPNNIHITYTYQIFNCLNYIKQWFSTLLPRVPFSPYASSFLKLTASNCTSQTICI